MIAELLPDEALALTIYGEARGETIEGQIAVANIIMNRWKGNPNKYKTVKEVCLEPLQFSCWNKTDPNYSLLLELGSVLLSGTTKMDPILRQCLFIARGAMGSNFIDNTNGAKNYMTTALLNSPNKPSWANKRTGEVKIGRHTFFNV